VASRRPTPYDPRDAAILGRDRVMKGKTPVNVGASVRARLLKVSKERHEDFTLMLMNYAAERFLYRLSKSTRRNQFVLKGAMLFAVRIGEPYRPTRDLDLLGTGAPSEAAIEAAVRDIVTTPTEDDGVSFDLDTLQIHPIRKTIATVAFAPSCRPASRKRAFTSRSTSASGMRSHRRRSTWSSRRCW
jgi:hypothetical protein